MGNKRNKKRRSKSDSDANSKPPGGPDIRQVKKGDEHGRKKRKT